MNLAVVHSVGLRTLGGMERALLDLMSEAVRGGHRVLIVCRPDSDFGAAARSRGIPVVELPLRGEWDLDSMARLRSEMQKFAVDAAVVTLHRDARMTGLARRGGSLPAIVIIKGIPLRRGSLARRLTYRHFVDGVIAPTKWLEAEIRSHPWAARLPIQAIPDGLDEGRFPAAEGLAGARIESRLHRGMDAGTALFLSAGHFVENKNFAALPRRLAALPPSLDWQWWLAGDGPGEAAIRSAVSAAGIAERVRLLGRREDLPELLLGADAVLVPSLHEQLPLIALEAKRAGVPHVVVSRTGDELEMTRLGIQLLDCDDEPGWIAALTAACADSGRAGSIPSNWDRDLSVTTAARLAFIESVVRARKAGA